MDVTQNEFYRSQFWRLQKPIVFVNVSKTLFYRSQFWRLQKPMGCHSATLVGFIGHNFGDYKNLKWYQLMTP